MKLVLISILLSFQAFGAITESERSELRQKAMKYCESRKGTYAIWFLVDQGKAQAVCRNGEKTIVELDHVK